MILLAVIGNPVAHSRSPDIHHAFAAQLGLEVSYKRILGQAFESDVIHFFAEGGVGLNVTVPFKSAAFTFARHLSPRAELAGTVNTLFGNLKTGLNGDTTDGAGLVADLRDNLGVSLKGLRILVLGAGGAVRGVLDDLATAGVASIDVLNRTHARAVVLEETFRNVRAVAPEISAGPWDVIINGTSTGLQGVAPTLPLGAVGRHTVGYEMVYGPVDTAFMAELRSLGAARVVDGLGMLVEQAARSFAIWTDRMPVTAPVISDLRQRLGYRP